MTESQYLVSSKNVADSSSTENVADIALSGKIVLGEIPGSRQICKILGKKFADSPVTIDHKLNAISDAPKSRKLVGCAALGPMKCVPNDPNRPTGITASICGVPINPVPNNCSGTFAEQFATTCDQMTGRLNCSKDLDSGQISAKTSGKVDKTFDAPITPSSLATFSINNFVNLFGFKVPKGVGCEAGAQATASSTLDVRELFMPGNGDYSGDGAKFNCKMHIIKRIHRNRFGKLNFMKFINNIIRL